MINSRDINDLRADVAINCRKLIEISKQQGIDIIITSTVRDDAYQKKLYAQGRTTQGSIVTKLQLPTFHWNKAGLAFDFCPVDKNGVCLWARGDLFAKVGRTASEIGFSWGGDWVGFVDKPHVQWDNKGRSSNADVRALRLPPTMAKYEGKEEEKMTLQEAIEILKTKVGLSDDTVKFLLAYKYGDELVFKLAKNIK